jgi:hypothetical protein
MYGIFSGYGEQWRESVYFTHTKPKPAIQPKKPSVERNAPLRLPQQV